ncbi:MAG: hypothetical protein HDS69_05280 [Bacteroidales bacterium]|nr:hypothetical protein [Bacteroidales bacterium]
MKKLSLVSLPAILLGIFVIFFTSCAQEIEESTLLEENENNIESQYIAFHNQPTISLLSSVYNQSSRGNFIPELTRSDIEFFKSLSKDELISFRDSMLSLIGENASNLIEDYEYDCYLHVFDIMGGNEQMEKYINFASEYLNSEGGTEVLSRIAPISLNKTQQLYYAAMATYIDYIARPIKNAMMEVTAENFINSRADRADCILHADYRLGLAGVTFGVEMLVGIMTGGVAIPAELVEDAASLTNLADIWLEYEACNGRWH